MTSQNLRILSQQSLVPQSACVSQHSLSFPFFSKSNFVFPQVIHFILVLFILPFFFSCFFPNQQACSQSIINWLSTPLSEQCRGKFPQISIKQNGHICNCNRMKMVAKGKGHLRNTFFKEQNLTKLILYYRYSCYLVTFNMEVSTRINLLNHTGSI